MSGETNSSTWWWVYLAKILIVRKEWTGWNNNISLYRKILQKRISQSQRSWHLSRFVISSGQHFLTEEANYSIFPPLMTVVAFSCPFIFTVIRIQVGFYCSHLREPLQTLTSAPFWPSWRRCCTWQLKRWEVFKACAASLFRLTMVSTFPCHPSVRGNDGGWQRWSQQGGVAVLVLGSAG